MRGSPVGIILAGVLVIAFLGWQIFNIIQVKQREEELGQIQKILGKADAILSLSYDVTITTLSSPDKKIPITSRVKAWEKEEQLVAAVTEGYTTKEYIKNVNGLFRHDVDRDLFIEISALYKDTELSLQPAKNIVNHIGKQDTTIQKVGSEVVDEKQSMILEYVTNEVDSETVLKHTVWIWEDKGLPLKTETRQQGEEWVIEKVEYQNFEFKDIPDSLFEVPQQKRAKLLAVFPEKYSTVGEKEIAFSQNGEKVAYRVGGLIGEPNIDKEEFIVLNGIEQKHYEEVGRPKFNSEGKLVYFAREKGLYFIVVDGQESLARFNGIGYGVELDTITFGPTKPNIVAYKAKKGHKEVMVVDNQEGKLYDEVGIPVFSPDGKHLAYTAKEGSNMFIVVDDEERKRYTTVNTPIYSPDSKYIAYSAKQGSDYMMVVNTRETTRNPFVELPEYAFSPNSEQLVSLGWMQEKSSQLKRSTIFYVTFLEQYTDGLFAVKQGNTYRFASGPIVFSSDGEHLIYKASDGGFRETYYIQDGLKGKKYNNIYGYKFSPDNKHLAFSAYPGRSSINGKAISFIVWDGKEGKDYQSLIDPLDPISFSSNSNLIAYGAETIEYPEEYLVVIGESEGPRFDYIWKPTFDKSSVYVLYGARVGNELWYVTQAAPVKELLKGIFLKNEEITDLHYIKTSSQSRYPWEIWENETHSREDYGQSGSLIRKTITYPNGIYTVTGSDVTFSEANVTWGVSGSPKGAVEALKGKEVEELRFLGIETIHDGLTAIVLEYNINKQQTRKVWVVPETGIAPKSESRAEFQDRVIIDTITITNMNFDDIPQSIFAIPTQ